MTNQEIETIMEPVGKVLKALQIELDDILKQRDDWATSRSGTSDEIQINDNYETRYKLVHHMKDGLQNYAKNVSQGIDLNPGWTVEQVTKDVAIEANRVKLNFHDYQCKEGQLKI
ncbi:MAG: hypothetical protein HOP08_17410 [Cyclobacteriaceae bacterium]|nr:hypothetical protein [Cyclobacteriaceae bacterium]